MTRETAKYLTFCIGLEQQGKNRLGISVRRFKRDRVRFQVRASFFDEIANKVERKNENVTLDLEMRESHQLCEDMFIFSKVSWAQFKNNSAGCGGPIAQR